MFVPRSKDLDKDEPMDLQGATTAVSHFEAAYFRLKGPDDPPVVPQDIPPEAMAVNGHVPGAGDGPDVEEGLPLNPEPAGNAAAAG